MLNGQCLTTMVTSSRRSSGQDMGFGGLRMANSKSGDYNLFSSGNVLEFLGGAPMLVSRERDLCHVRLHPTWFESTSECRSWTVASNLYNEHLPMSWSRVSFASWSTFWFPSITQSLGIQQKRTCMSLLLNNQSRFMIWQIKGFSVPSPSISCK